MTELRADKDLTEYKSKEIISLTANLRSLYLYCCVNDRKFTELIKDMQEGGDERGTLANSLTRGHSHNKMTISNGKSKKY